MRRRRTVEVFGLAMLDTVTCSLGGGIVLLLFIASQIPPGASVSFSNATAVAGKDGGEGGPTAATGILAIFFEFDKPTDPEPLVPERCDGARGNSDDGKLSTVLLGGAVEDEIFDVGKLPRFGYAVWWRGVPEELPDSVNCLQVNLGAHSADCARFFYIAGGHQAAWRECPGNSEELVFRREPEGSFGLEEVSP